MKVEALLEENFIRYGSGSDEIRELLVSVTSSEKRFAQAMR